jgi:hypothetical protein
MKINHDDITPNNVYINVCLKAFFIGTVATTATACWIGVTLNSCKNSWKFALDKGI